MANAPSPAISKLLSLTVRPLAARAFPEFMEHVREGTQVLHQTLLAGDAWTSPQGAQEALSAALVQTRSNPLRRRVLELCSWPIFDKPSLPDTDEILRLFALPVLVQLPVSRSELLVLPGDFLRTDAVVETLERAGCLHPLAVVSGFSTLFSREDLHLHGPMGIAQYFVDAETTADPILPEPLPLVLDPDIESARSVLLYVLLAARMPPVPDALSTPGAPWPLAEIAHIVEQDLQAAGIEPERVDVFNGCSMVEALLRCAGPNVKEMERWLDLGMAHYGLSSISLVLPVEGIAELVGHTPRGAELLLAPSFSYVEPRQVLEAAIRNLCVARGLAFKGRLVGVLPTSSALH